MSWTCTIDGTDLGIIDDLSVTKESSLTCFDDPDTDSDQQEFSDDSGAKKSYNIQGNYGSVSWSTIVNWKDGMMAKVTGSQYDDGQNHVLVIYCPDEAVYIENNINVMIESFEYRMKGGDSPNCTYTLKCYQSVPL